MVVVPALKGLFAGKGIEPSYPKLPLVDERGESNLPGVYVIGELAGTPLVKLGLNAGHDIVELLAPELKRSSSSEADLLDLVIVGSGSSGFAACLAAKDHGLRAVTFEASAFANTFVTMTRGKWLFSEPANVKLRSRVWFEECTKEDLLERWQKIREQESLDIRENEKVFDLKGGDGNFTVVTDSGEYRARKVILAMGKAGNPRTLGVPGEKDNVEKIAHRLLDPDDYTGKQIIVVGGGDVACEAAIALARDTTNTVTLSAIDQEFSYPKRRNIDAVRALEDQGQLRILLGSTVTAIGSTEVSIKLRDGSTEAVPCDALFEMIGAELPLKFFSKIGLRLADSWNLNRWITLTALFILVHALYALKSYGKGITAWPYEDLIAPESYYPLLLNLFEFFFAPFAFFFGEAQLTNIYADYGYQQGFLYSLTYTVVMLVFGYEALIRWRSKAADPRYQTWRYISLISFQIIFFLFVNMVAVKALSVKYAWRAWGIYQPFPLFFNTFFWWYPGDPAWIVWTFVVLGLLGTFIGIPVLARNHGKRFCTWICGCGGLAETLGDRWRHLSAKGRRSREWEFQSALVLFASIIVALVVVGMYQTDGNNIWWRSYNYLVDFWLVAVIPIALYPFFGGKVWCRYWCPLAAYNQLLSRWYGRLKIISNDKCISCTECSKYCQVGVDVMAFAKNQEPFDNSNSSCIHCGICIDVCPMQVLSFETSSESALVQIQHRRGAG